MNKVQLYFIVKYIIGAYEVILFIRIIMSYMNIDPYHPLARILYRLTDPVMELVRRHIPCEFGMIDFSPMVIIFILFVLQKAIATLLFRM